MKEIKPTIAFFAENFSLKTNATLGSSEFALKLTYFLSGKASQSDSLTKYSDFIFFFIYCLHIFTLSTTSPPETSLVFCLNNPSAKNLSILMFSFSSFSSIFNRISVRPPATTRPSIKQQKKKTSKTDCGKN